MYSLQVKTCSAVDAGWLLPCQCFFAWNVTCSTSISQNPKASFQGMAH